MAMRFRRSIGLSKGIRLNLSKGGVGASVGGKGLRYSVHSSGRRTTSAGIPGSGMAYVSTKSSSSSSNSMQRAQSGQMTESQARQLQERFDRKMKLLEERKSKAIELLKSEYADGKINKEQYENLSKRYNEIDVTLILFGRNAGVKLAERYVLGKIDKTEFEIMKHELLGEVDEESKNIEDKFNSQVLELNEVINKSRANSSDTQCSYCNKPKKFLSPLYKVQDFKVCGSCKKKINGLQEFNSYIGKYYTNEYHKIIPGEKNDLKLIIKPEYLLDYR